MTSLSKSTPQLAAADELSPAQLQYFGRMAANISHELRNNLATINEIGGLISDLVAFSARGRPLDEARVGRLAEDVSRRVMAATAVCERLNSLAHAPDTALRTVEINAVTTLVATLMERQARVSNVTFELELSDPINIEVEPILLQLIVHLCLLWTTEHRPDSTISIHTGREDRLSAFIRFSGVNWKEFLESRSTALDQCLDALDATLECGDHDELLLLIPTMRATERDAMDQHPNEQKEGRTS